MPRIVEIQKMLEGMMGEVREYSYELNPSTVERAGLRAALDRLATRTRTHFGGALRIHADPSVKIDPKIASASLSHRPRGCGQRRPACGLLRH